ncbi:Dps family protein [Deminuibacter soli]|uniref:DNA starvation/stationary phase protection protein n=1 Tax=Deminuibacter soli TaxID=2291815 RepID=A0A3E1NGW7_9BACT|nr:DNA starvation/stationary phase protection protein [Deminuibacter soli]RFM27183.1 DNA starvation/stationary phase protection protein [Deminuibacter soli]
MNANIGLSEEHKAGSVKILGRILADEFVLYTKTRNFHWNVEGSNFVEMHTFYEKMYDELDEVFDEVAERIRMLGHYSQGRLKDFLQVTSLLEEEYTNDQQKQLQSLLSDHETVIRLLRNDIDELQDKMHDAGNADFVTGLLKQHEKWAWFIRSYLR